jgi:ATP-dependent Clp protease ATP-binding subunit ClpA
VFQTLTDMATMRTLLEAAERESAVMGEPDPGAEHVVLAALALPDHTAGDALAELGVDAARLRAAIEQVHADALAALGLAEPPAPTPIPTPTNRGVYRSKGSTRDLLTATAEARRTLHARRFTSAHILIGASALEHGTLPKALHELGIDAATLRRTALRHASTTG